MEKLPYFYKRTWVRISVSENFVDIQTTSACSKCSCQCFLKHSAHWRVTSIDQRSTHWTSSTGNLTYVPCRTSSQLQNPNQHQHPALQTSIQVFFHLCIHARHLLLSTSLKPLEDTKDLSSLTVRLASLYPQAIRSASLPKHYSYHSTNSDGRITPPITQMKLHRYNITVETHQYLHPKLVLENKALGQLRLYIKHGL